MKYYFYPAIGMSFLLHVSLSTAMQLVRSEKKIERTVFDVSIQKTLQPTSIACVHSDIITIIDPAKYQQWNYHANKTIEQKESNIVYGR